MSCLVSTASKKNAERWETEDSPHFSYSLRSSLSLLNHNLLKVEDKRVKKWGKVYVSAWSWKMLCCVQRSLGVWWFSSCSQVLQERFSVWRSPAERKIRAGATQFSSTQPGQLRGSHQLPRSSLSGDGAAGPQHQTGDTIHRLQENILCQSMKIRLSVVVTWVWYFKLIILIAQVW